MKLKNISSWALMGLFSIGVLSFTLPSNPPLSGESSTAKTGAIVGKITYDGAVPRLKPINMSAFPACAAQYKGKAPNESLVLGDGNTVANVFVQIKNPPFVKQQKNLEPVVMDLNKCMLQPRVLGVQVGQPLKFVNSDGLVYNLTGKPKNNAAFSLPLNGRIGEQTLFFDEADAIFGVKCDVHPWVSGYIAVMTHPYFMVTDEDGRFTFNNLPEGTYEIEVTHERLGTKIGTIDVRNGQARLDFSFERKGRN